MRKCVFTIASNNYLHFVRTLLASVKINNLDVAVYCFIVDRDIAVSNKLNEEFRSINIRELDIPSVQKFIFKYTLLELNTAIKPWGFKYLFREGYEEIIFLDPDIFVYNSLKKAFSFLDNGIDVILTPHLTQPIDDGYRPTELDIRRAGTYNLGFIGLRKCKNTDKLLEWWKSKLINECIVDLDRGIFVDQSWVDLVPGLFENVYILRDFTYNTAYWNISGRRITKKKEKWFVNNEELVFFHFSGISPMDTTSFSKHQNRQQLSTIGEASKLVFEYANKLLLNGVEKYEQEAYGFAVFEDGEKITDSMRRCFRLYDYLQGCFGENPFRSSRIFFKEISIPISELGGRTIAIDNILSLRNDVRNYFFGNDNKQKKSLVDWFLEEGGAYYPKSILDLHRKYSDFDEGRNRIEHLFQNILSRLPENENSRPTIRILSSLLAILLSRAIRLMPQSIYRFLKKIRALLNRKNKKTREKPYVKTRLVVDGFNTDGKKSLNNNAFKAQRKIEGVNIVGYLKGEWGIGEGVRSLAKAINSVNLKYSAIDVGYQSDNLQRDDSTFGKSLEDKFPVDIIYVNADQTPRTLEYLNSLGHRANYRIGFWHWEQTSLPEKFHPGFLGLNEIWVPSAFVQDSITPFANVPLYKVPHCIFFSVSNALRREYWKLPENKFLFLVMYDLLSYQYRKNPEAAINAFKLAFSNNNNVALVIKVNNADKNKEEIKIMKEKLDCRNYFIIDQNLTRQETYELESQCNAFLSLHRAEGFGLGLAEMMYLGKPVVGTGWSGNMEFMTPMNSFLVNYELRELKEPIGVYEAGMEWAEADIEHAAWGMQKIVDDSSYRQEMSRIAMQDIRNRLSPTRIGNRILERFNRINYR